MPSPDLAEAVMPTIVSLAIGLGIYLYLMVFLGLNAATCQSPGASPLFNFVQQAVALCWLG